MATSEFYKLSEEEFVNLIKNGPLVSIDLIVRNNKEEVLLGLRKNAPAKGTWFVPGGRIGKNEKLQDAFQRISEYELKLKLDLINAESLGIFEHFYENENIFGREGVDTHYVVLAYVVRLSQSFSLQRDDQHSAFKWFKVDDLMSDDAVHINVKAYFAEAYTIPNDSGIYNALVSQYIHCDQLFWSRTQIILAVQGAGLIGGYNLRYSWLSFAIMIGTFLITLIVWFIILRDIGNSRVNQNLMDKLANKIFNYAGPGQVVQLRSKPLREWLAGRSLIRIIVYALLFLNYCLAIYYMNATNLLKLKEFLNQWITWFKLII